MNKELEVLLKNAKSATRYMMNVSTETKNQALLKISEALMEYKDDIVEANRIDIKNARDNGMSEAMIDRLLLDENRIESIAKDVKKLIDLTDPVGELIREIKRPNGIIIQQVRVPIGVFGIIYESRPNVTVDIACLCIKSGNVCVLKGGKEAIHSNKKLVSIMNNAIKNILPEDAVSLIENTDRQIVSELITANDYVDVVVPRGGAGLIQHVVKNATVAVIETGAGNCHLYIDKDADINKAIAISVNAKIQRPSVCNAIETILVHEDISNIFLPEMVRAFEGRIEIRGDIKTQEIIECQKATLEDYATEYDDYIVAIKVVHSLDEVIDHIYKYSTKHSECIVTENNQTAQIFLTSLDSACVYHNASTRFSDGGEFGFGAELGISTQKLHARGPLALLEMTSSQYRIEGNGQVRE
ncbi:MAG: glutamate-5-semialdehyde dehydrogenase [Coprobacillus sp.]